MKRSGLKQLTLFRFVVYSTAAVVCGYLVGWHLIALDDAIYEDSFNQRLLTARVLAITCYLSASLIFLFLSKAVSFLFLLPKDTLLLFVPHWLGIAILGSVFVTVFSEIYLPYRFNYFFVGLLLIIFTVPIMALARLYVYLSELIIPTKEIR